MIVSQKNSLCYFTFSKFVPFSGIRHGIFSRIGGFSQIPFHSLNAGLSVGDSPDVVMQNRTAISEHMGGAELVFLHQTHDTHVVIFDKNEPVVPSSKTLPPISGDAMVSNVPGKTLAIQVADCQAVQLFDPVKKVIANVHSGWRGSIQNIVGKCVENMKTHFNCRPEEIIAGVSPSLGPCCSEFIHYKTEIPEHFWPYKDPRHHFNFWRITSDQLKDSGLPPENIELSNLCTKCNDHLFFSYRQTKQTGRFVSAIGLK
ncbi:MAG: peptidoglycan editing factor PgeF [Desulfobacteraceae bacterium]|nr:MAG: peptidoglycan editing factor PgeF [Desulfobacteraceae bacterium]